MAEHITDRRSFSIWWGVTIAGAVATSMATALAQNLPDPTRPPATQATAEVTVAGTPAAPELQSVLISAGRRVAIISGKSVSVGDKYGDARIVRITDGEVVLRSGRDLRTLKLFPGIEKKIISPRRTDVSSDGGLR